MKFGKNISRAMGLSNPEWSPFWVDYKMLKKIIKELPTVVPCEDNSIRKNPNEVKFFKYVHKEFQKVSTFFDKAKKELKIRYDRVTVGKEIFGSPGSEVTADQWTRIERSAYKLHSSLLLLEGFAIMNYCAFSKILKKHDKRTGYSTKVAFMTKVVNNSNFAAYPEILAMIRGCEALIDQCSQHLKSEEKSNLGEDEKFFLGLVQKITTSYQKGTEDGDGTNTKSCSPANNGVVTPVSERPTVRTTPRQLDAMFMDLNKERRVRSVSDHSITSKSPKLPTEDRENYRNEAFDCRVQKRRISQATIQLFKKQRCL